MGLRKEIRVVLDQVTLDPRSALRTIAALLDPKIDPTKAVKPVFRVDVSDTDDGKIKVTIDHNAKKIRPDHAMAAACAIAEFAAERVAEAKADGCKCADHCGGPAK